MPVSRECFVDQVCEKGGEAERRRGGFPQKITKRPGTRVDLVEPGLAGLAVAIEINARRAAAVDGPKGGAGPAAQPFFLARWQRRVDVAGQGQHALAVTAIALDAALAVPA